MLTWHDFSIFVRHRQWTFIDERFAVSAKGEMGTGKEDHALITILAYNAFLHLFEIKPEPFVFVLCFLGLYLQFSAFLLDFEIVKW